MFQKTVDSSQCFSAHLNSFNPVPDKLPGATKLPLAPMSDKLSGVLVTFVLASYCFNGMNIYNEQRDVTLSLLPCTTRACQFQAFGVFLASIFASFLSCNEQASVEKCEASWRRGFP